MTTLTVIARLVNGGLLEYPAPPELLGQIQRLRAQGFEGKKLIHEAITDDWGAPPTVVEIMDGDRLMLRIPYS